MKNIEVTAKKDVVFTIAVNSMMAEFLLGFTQNGPEDESEGHAALRCEFFEALRGAMRTV